MIVLATVALAQALPPSMSVARLAASLSTCRGQLAANTLDVDKPMVEGWQKIARIPLDANGSERATYRHPKTPLEIGLIRGPGKIMQCVVTAPIDADLTTDVADNTAEMLFGKPRGTAWMTGDVSVVRDGTPSKVRFTFTKKAKK